MQRTQSACSVTFLGDDFISGVEKSGVDKSSCEQECRMHSWCIGIRVVMPNSDGFDSCRLLTKEKPERKDGWNRAGFGNWAEPNQWKNGYEFANYEYKCYEKVATSMCIITKYFDR